MKNIKNIIKKALLFTGSTLLLAACSLNVPPPDQFSDPDAITDVNTGRALLTSCYLSYPHQEYDFSLLECKIQIECINWLCGAGKGSAFWVALLVRGPGEEVGCLETYGGILHEWQYLV